MLISPEYRDMNAALHTEKPAFGSHGHHWASEVLDIFMREGCESILDYGCGKASLSAALAGYAVAEYDPAIPGKDARPQPSDLTVCTDVLEHIEPECLDRVLADICDLTIKRLFFSISLVPAKKTLPDGRNAHLIVQPSEWWMDRLSKHFQLTKWEDCGHHLFGEAIPIKPLNDITHTVAVGNDERNQQVAINCAAVASRLAVDGEVKCRPPLNRRAVVVCFGPSLKHTWPQIAMDRHTGDADVFTVSAAHKFMIERGVIPKAHIDCDPRPHKAVQIGDIHPAVEYWLASCIHPSFVEKVQAGGGKVALWHAYNGQESKQGLRAVPSENRQFLITGGGSVGLRAISLLYYMGYRDFDVHGMDCSWEDGHAYAGEHLGKPKQHIRVRVGQSDRWFDTSPVFVLYARYFAKTILLLKGANIRLHGDGMLQAMHRD